MKGVIRMNDKKETFVGPIEQKINSMMEDAGNEIMELSQKGTSPKEGEVVQKIHIINLSKCIILLAKEIDKLAKSIKLLKLQTREEEINN